MPFQAGRRPGWKPWFSALRDVFDELYPDSYALEETQMADDWHRLSIKRGGVTGGDKSFYLDVMPGPTTPFGPSAEIRTPSGWNYVVGAEIFGKESAGGEIDPQFRTPFESLATYVESAYRMKGLHRGVRSAFFSSMATGSSTTAGGVQMYGPSHNIAAQLDYASRVTLGTAPGVQMDDLLGSVGYQMQAPPSGSPYESLRGYGLWRGDDQVTRLRNYISGSYWQSGPTPYDISMHAVGPDEGKAIKHANVSRFGGLREVPQLYSGTQIAQPGGIGARAGYKQMDLLMPGETTPRNVMLQQGVFKVPVTPFAGASMWYQDPLQGMTGRYHQEASIGLNVPSMGMLPRGRFESGIFQQGGGGEWERVSGLKGYTLGAGQTATVGLFRYQEGGEEQVQPISYTAGGGNVVFRGDPTLRISKGYIRQTGQPHQGVLPPGQTKFPNTYAELHDPGSQYYDPQYMEAVRQGFGGRVEATLGDQGPQIAYPIAQEVGISYKGMAQKHAPMMISQAVGQALSPEISVAGQQRPVSGVLGEVKNVLEFTGVFGAAFSREQKAQFVEDVYGSRRGSPGHALSSYIRGIEEGGFVSMEEMGRIYSQATRTQTDPEVLFEQMGRKFHQMAWDQPEQTMEKYGAAYARNQWVNLGTVPAETKQFYREEFFNAMKLENASRVEQGKQPMTEAEMNRTYGSTMRFAKRGDQYEWSMRMTGMYGPAAMAMAPEFMSRMPRWGMAEVSAFSQTYPQASRAAGMHVSQKQGATGFIPGHVRAWNQLRELYAYAQDPQGGVIPPSATTLTMGQVEKIREGMSGMKTTDFDAMSEVVQAVSGGSGLLRHPESGALIARPGTMAGVSEIEYEGTEEQMVVNRLSKGHLGHWQEFLGGRGAEKGQGKIFFDELRRVATSGGGMMAKYQTSRFLPGSIGGRFVGTTAARMGEFLTSEENLKQMISGRLGTKFYGEQLEEMVGKEYQTSLERGWALGAFGRDPVTLREGGVQATRIVTPEMLRRHRGVEAELPRGYVGALGTGGAQMMPDFDADNMKLAVMGKVTSRGLDLAGFGEMVTATSGPYENLRAQADYWMQAGFGGRGGVAGGEFDIWATTFREIFGDQDATKLRRMGITETTPEKLWATSMKQMRGYQGMGKAYNLRRWMEASATSLGWSAKGISGLNMAGASSYQEYLDFLRSDPTNLEQLFQTTTVTADLKGSGMKISGMTTGGGFSELMTSGQSAGGADPLASAMMAALVEGEHGSRPEYGLGLMAMNEGQMFEMQKRYQGGEDYGSLLREMITGEGYDFTQTPGGLALWSSMAGKLTGETRMMGLPHKSRGASGRRTSTFSQIKGMTERFFFGGKNRTISQIVESDPVQATLGGYQLQTGYGGPITATQLGLLAQYAAESDAPIGQYALGLEGRAAHFATVLRDSAQNVATKGEALSGMTGAERKGIYQGWLAQYGPEIGASLIRERTRGLGPSVMPGAERAWQGRRRTAGTGQPGGIQPPDEPPISKWSASAADDPGGRGPGGSDPKFIFLGGKERAEQELALEQAALALGREGDFSGFGTAVSKYIYEEFGVTGETAYQQVQAVQQRGGADYQQFLRRFAPWAKEFAGATRQIRAGGRAMRALGDVTAAEVIGEEKMMQLKRAGAPAGPLGQAIGLPELVRGAAKEQGIKGARTPLEDSIEGVREAFDKLVRTTEKTDKSIEAHGEYSKEAAAAVREQKVAGHQLMQARYQMQAEGARGDMEGLPEGSPARMEAEIDYFAKTRQAGAAGMAARQAGAPPSGRAAANVGMRRLLGGWNLFYMQRLLGLGASQFQQGYQEFEQFAGAAEAGAIRRMGVDAVDVRQSAETQYQQALLRSGGGVMRQFRQMQAGVVGSGFSDIAGAALTGVGIGTLADFVAPALSGMGEAGGMGLLSKGGEFLSANASRIGAVAAVGALGYSIYSGAQNYEDTVTRAAASYGGGGVIDRLGAAWQNVGPYLRDVFRGDNVFAPRSTQMYHQLGTMAQEYGEGGRVREGLSQAQTQRLAQVIAMTDIPELAHLTPEIKMQLGVPLMEAGFGRDVMAQMGTAIQAGLPILETAAGINWMVGGAPMTEGQTIASAAQQRISGMTSSELLQLQTGSKLATQMPGYQEYLRGKTGYRSYWEAQQSAMQLSQVAGGPNEARFLQQWGAQQQFADLGLDRPSGLSWGQFGRDEQWTPDMRWAFAQNQALMARGAQVGQTLAGAGVSRDMAQGALDFGLQNMGQMSFMQGLVNLSPVRMAQMGQAGGGTFFDNLANVDINLGGDITGLGWGTTSLTRGGTGPEAMATQIWGDRWRGGKAGAGTWQPPEWAQAAVYGIETPSGDTVAGTRGLQWLQFYNQQEAQQARMGIQAQQIALQERYQPMFWNIEDQQRALSHQQAQWGFQYQQQQFQLQGQQFGENMAFQQMQRLTQRGWAQQDWQYQDQTRAMQWGWTQEDFQENVRFMSGRQRRLAERQMERQTITHGMEGDRIETLRDRQREMWRMEDERHELSIKHFEEQRVLQAEHMEKQVEFYTENKRLQDEMLELRREYWKEQMELQKQSLAISEQELKRNMEIQAAIMELRDTQEDYNGMQRIAQETQTETLNALISGLNHIIEHAPDALRSIIEQDQIFIPGIEGSADTGGATGSSSSLDDWRISLPDQEFSSTSGGNQSVTVYIGNERLGEYVVDSFNREVRVG
jgi:hypothetical protein